MTDKLTVRRAWSAESPATVAPASWVLCFAYNLALGALFLAGGPTRITSPSFSTIREFGGHIMVGTVFVVLGVVMAASVALSLKMMASVLGVGAVFHVALAAGFLTAIFAEPPSPDPMDPRAALIGPLLPLFPAAVHLIRAKYYWHLSEAVDSGGIREGP